MNPNFLFFLNYLIKYIIQNKDNYDLNNINLLLEDNKFNDIEDLISYLYYLKSKIIIKSLPIWVKQKRKMNIELQNYKDKRLIYIKVFTLDLKQEYKFHILENAILIDILNNLNINKEYFNKEYIEYNKIIKRLPFKDYKWLIPIYNFILK